MPILILFFKMLKNWSLVVCLFPSFKVEIDDLKKITNSLTVLCSEKQKQEKVSICIREPVEAGLEESSPMAAWCFHSDICVFFSEKIKIAVGYAF